MRRSRTKTDCWEDLHANFACLGVVCSLVTILCIFVSTSFAQNVTTNEYSLSGLGVGSSSVVTYDIDPELNNGKEIFAASSNGVISALRQTGEEIWSMMLPIARCRGLSPQTTRLFSSPAVGDLFGNGRIYLSVGYGAFGTKKCGGGLAVIDAHNGRMYRNINLKRVSKQQKFWAQFHTVYNSPFMSDLNGDRVQEIGFGSWDRHFYLLSGATPILQYQAADTIWSSPSIVPSGKAGKFDVVLATDISANSLLNPPTQNGGHLYLLKSPHRNLRKVGRTLRKRGRARAKFRTIGFRQKAFMRWLKETPQVLFSSPSVGELIESNPGLEIAIGSGCYFPENTNDKSGKWIRIYSATSGELLRELPLPACTPSSPALADFNGDGRLEVAITVSGAAQIGGSGRSTVHVFNPETGEELWSRIPRAEGFNDSWGGNFLEIAAGDLDGNGSIELVVANGNAVHVFSGSSGDPLSCDLRDCEDGRYTFSAQGVARTSPVIDDLDGDGETELIIGGGGSRQGKVFVWSNLKEVIHSEPGPHPAYSLPWPMFKNNPGRTGVLE